MADAAPIDIAELSDGTKLELARVPGIDDSTWQEVKDYLASNPEMAKRLQKFAKNPDAMRGWLQTQAIAEHYSGKLGAGETAAEDSRLQERLQALELDAELAPIFEDIKKNGMEAMLKYYHDEELMLKVNQRMGGVPQELQAKMKTIEGAPFNIHEAAKVGDLKALNNYLAKKQPLDAQDATGITPLGYAIGTNRIASVKLLLGNRANPFSVDSSGNSGLHYAAGYGRKELVEYLLKLGTSPAQCNAQGQTPIDVASVNKQTGIVDMLRARVGSS